MSPPKPPHRGPHHGPPYPPGPLHHEGGRHLLVSSALVGIGVTAVCAIALYLFGVPTNVILPTSAPILVGATTLAYTFQSR